MIPGYEKKLTGVAYYQMFEKKYTNFVLELAKEEKYSHWSIFHLRTAVFSKDKRQNKWVLTWHEVKLTREGLENAVKEFKNDQETKKMVEFLEKYKQPSSLNQSNKP